MRSQPWTGQRRDVKLVFIACVSREMGTRRRFGTDVEGDVFRCRAGSPMEEVIVRKLQVVVSM